MNPTDIIQELKDNVDIVDHLGAHYLDLQEEGSTYKALCPFHHNTDTPSLAVWKDSQTWWCFVCQEGNDVVDFVKKYHSVDTMEAVHMISEKEGLALKDSMTEREKREYAKRKRLYELMHDASEYFHSNLMNTENGKQAYYYLTTYRGIEEDQIKSFKLGYAPDDWYDAITHLRNQGYSDEELTSVGLASENGRGLYCPLRDRVIFPITDTAGRVVAFGGRITKQGDGAKYLNTQNSLIFSKSKTVFGLKQAKEEVTKGGTVVVVEGYLDAITAHQYGFNNVVSVMGVSFTEEQARLLAKLARKVIIAFDADQAGNSAAIKVALKVESKIDADIYVAALPGTLDPDELIREDSNKFSLAVWNAKPLIAHYTNDLIERRNGDLWDPKVKRDIANEVLPLIESVGDPTEQAAYKEWLAKQLGFEKYKLTIVSPNGKRFEVDN